MEDVAVMGRLFYESNNFNNTACGDIISAVSEGKESI